MENMSTVMSSKGQIVIPVELRKELGLIEGTRFTVYTDKHNNIVIAKVPTRSDWEEVLANVPVEDVDLDKDGHYDPKKSPQFHKWMKEG